MGPLIDLYLLESTLGLCSRQSFFQATRFSAASRLTRLTHFRLALPDLQMPSPVASCLLLLAAMFAIRSSIHRSDPRCCCLTSYLLIFTEHNNTLFGIVPPTSKLRCSVSRSCHPPNHHRPRTEMSWRAFPPLLSSAAATPPPDPPALGSGCPSPSTRCS